MRPLLFFFFLLLGYVATAQQSQGYKKESTSYVIEGKVTMADGQPIIGANIEGPAGRYASTGTDGTFSIPANAGDQIVIRGIDFETVYYTIRSGDELHIKVEDDSLEMTALSYTQALDSAQVYQAIDPRRASDYVIAALSNDPDQLTDLQQAAAYEQLGDIYRLSEQYDLAIKQYQRADLFVRDKERELKTAEALQKNGNYQEAIDLLQQILAFKDKKTEIKRLRSLADAYAAVKQQPKAILAYQQALLIAQDIGSPLIMGSINADLGANFNAQGDVTSAETYFNKALESADPVSQVVNKSKAADFYNQNNKFDEEIALRKSNIALLDSLSLAAKVAPIEEKLIIQEADAIYDTSEISVQKEQLKVAEALRSQNKNEEAVTFLAASLKKAEEAKDLETVKDAAKQLAEIYRASKNTNKALVYSEKYVNAVDNLYAEKEANLAIASRRAKELSARQNRILLLEKDRKLTENQLDLAKAQQDIAVQKNSQQRWVIYSLIALLLGMAIAAYLMYRNIQQQKINNHLLALKSLRSQMNPHFIFNALNSVNSFIAINDERAANKYLANFSKLMRSVLENSELDFIPLAKEIELLQLYIKLEHERFKDQFSYHFEVDPALAIAQIKVPPMLMQPIIENAVWHGLRYKEGMGQLTISLQAKNTDLLITVEDNGIGRQRSLEVKTNHQKKRSSKGIGNIKNRINLLHRLHKVDLVMDVQDAGQSPDVGTRVVLRFKNYIK